MADHASTLPRCFAVWGDPIGHSKSPRMHNAAFDALGQAHRYLAFRVRPGELSDAVKGIRALGFGGVNLTVPHKQAVLPLLDGLSPEAERIGAVNTLVPRDDGSWWGYSTDGAGFMAGLEQLRAEGGGAAPEHVVVLGGGGASRAVVDALVHASPRCHVTWVSRDPSRLPAWPSCTRASYDALATALERSTLVVNGTTVGMRGGPTALPVALPFGRMPMGSMAVDLVYPRPPGGLLDRAQEAGLATQDGLPMLLWQGVRAQELWQGRSLSEAAIAAMASALTR